MNNPHARASSLGLIACLALLLCGMPSVTPSLIAAQVQPNSRFFPETNRTIKGKFLTYWDAHGGLMQQGYPISDEFQERSDVDGKLYTVQYFQRAVFELHPEYAGTQYEVLLSQLGSFYYRQQFPNGYAIQDQQPDTSSGSVLFPQTGKRLGGVFLQYWQQHGGLAQQGYPITDELFLRNKSDRIMYRAQFFERAVFELHPENKGTSYEVLLSHLGTFRFNERYPKGTAPAYDAIYNTVAEIMSRHPEALQGLEIERPRELNEYDQLLKGMLVEGWQGWIDHFGSVYNPIVYLGDPGKNRQALNKKVTLRDISIEEGRAVLEWRGSHPDVGWPRVKISGVINFVDFDGRVDLRNARIEVVEQSSSP